jgi:hypothetical protein
LIENAQEPEVLEPTPVLASAEVVSTYAPVAQPEPMFIEPEAPEAEVVEEIVAAAEPVEEPKSKNDAPVQSKLAASKKVVSLSNLVFESKSRNSASVGLVQFRLVELGFLDAGSDKYGWLSAGTMKSLAQFAKTSVEKVNTQDEKLISRLFEGTSVEVVS